MDNLTKNNLSKTVQMDENNGGNVVLTMAEFEQMKSAVTVLVHLKYILFYVKEHFFIDIEYKINSFAPQLKEDLDLCQEKYGQLVESSKLLGNFARNNENRYQIKSTIYSPFKLDQSFVEVQPYIHELAFDLPNFNQNETVDHNSRSNNTELTNETCEYRLNPIKNVVVTLEEPIQEDLRAENACQVPNIVPESQNKRPKWRSSFSKASSSQVSSATTDENIAEESLNLSENDLLQVEYWCSFEGCRFKSKDLQLVKTHEELRHIKQMSKCFQIGCDERFVTKEELEKHISDAHSLVVTSSNLVPHVKCEIPDCDRLFPNDSKLRAHLRTDHKDEYLTCKICDRKFQTRRYMTKHFRIKHPKAKKRDLKRKGLNSRIKCTINECNENFSKSSELKAHMLQNHRDIYLTCKFCDRICKSRDNLTNHIWKMHQEGEFRCNKEGCDFVATKKNDLLNHEKKHHAKTRKCPIEGCEEMVRNQNFTKHLSSKHNIKNFACSWPDCGKLFGDKNKLKDHVRIHLNFKRFKCKWPECGYASEQRHTVITHVRVCHFKLPRTKKKQMEMNISEEELNRNPCDYVDACREDICV